MKICMITFRSVTPAQRAEELLSDHGIRCTLQRTPRWMQEQGCGYSLRLSCGEVPRAMELLRQKKLPYRKLYGQKEMGVWEEMAL